MLSRFDRYTMLTATLAVCLSLLWSMGFAADDKTASGGDRDRKRPKKIVLIAGKKSHGPGVHEYEKSVRLLKALLDTSPNLTGIKAEYHLGGWPEDEKTLDDADTIMTISDGQDGDKFSPVPFMTPERMAVMERQMKRGCGFITFHFSTFTPDRYGPQILDWGGGYFDWQNDKGDREWYSAIRTLEADVKLGTPEHPVLRGVKPFRIREEFYYRIRFRDDDKGMVKQVLVSVKSGHVSSAFVRDLRGTVEREKAAIGVLITLALPTSAMRKEAASSGHYQSPFGTSHPKIQIYTVEELLAGARVDMPRPGNTETFRRAPARQRRSVTGDLFDSSEEK